MKRILIYAFSAIVLFCTACSEVDAQGKKKESKVEYDIYLLIGQSNMAGRGALLEEDMEQIEGVWLLDGKDKPTPAANPLNIYSTVRKGADMQKMGPGYSFARKIASETGRPILLVVNALGGSSIGMWKKSADLIQDKSSIGYNERQLFEEIIVRARHAKKYGEIKGILWHQGEANARAKLIPYYLPALQQIVKDLRTELDIVSAPFIAGQLGTWGKNTENHTMFNEMITAISSSIPNSSYVSSEGCTPLSDNIHFDRESQLVMGERYADKILEMVYGKQIN